MTAKRPLVGVIMGSASDLGTMQCCLEQLGEFGIAYEARVISAHRTPDAAHEYAAAAADRGLKVIIAAAGMSAALGGVLASKTMLPVVGVPIDAGPLGGLDAAISTMQMPPGVPVACMAVGKAGARNAAIYAAEIIALGDQAVADKLANFRTIQAERVQAADAEVRRGG